MPGKAERRADPNEKGTANEGKKYTRQAYLDLYGKKRGAKIWDSAAPKTAAPKKKGLSGGKGKIEVGYWGIRGLCAPLRMMCYYKGVEFTDKRYTVKAKEGGGAGLAAWDRDEWLVEAKPALKELNPLMNLPYVKVGKQAVTQSNACLKFLGDTLGFKNSYANEQILCQVFDLRNDAVGVFYNNLRQTPPATWTLEEGKPKFEAHTKAGMAGHYGKLEAWLGAKKDAKFFSGRQPASGDFHAFEMLDQHEVLAKKLDLPSPMDGFPNLQAFHARFRAQPQLAKYFESDAYALPCNNPYGWLK